MNTQISVKSKIPLVIMVVVMSGAFLPLFMHANAATNTVSLKAILLSVDSIYTPPYSTQSAQNLLRNWGVPFDNVSIASVTPSTFWDSTAHQNKYQFIVVSGASSIGGEGTYPSIAVKAINASIINGTSILILGSAVSQLGKLLGYSSFIECPSNPQYGGRCPVETGTSLKVNVNNTFAGPTAGDKTWQAGSSFVATGTPSVATLSVRPRAVVGTTVFASYSVNGTTYPLASFKKVGTSMVWWIGGIQGAYTDYLTGWSYMFQSLLPGNDGTLFRPVEDLFEYALNNVTASNTPRMLSWGQYGSDEVIRIGDHVSLTSAACNSTQITHNNLSGEINLNLNGISNSVLQSVSSVQPVGVTNPRGVSGFRYFGAIGGGATGTNNLFELAATVNNMTSVSNDGTSTKITSSHSIAFPITDANTTTIQKIAVLLNTSSIVQWQLSFDDSRGVTLWTSSIQSTPLASPTWVKFSNMNFTDALTSGVNDIQGVDKITLSVTSGIVSWANSSAAQSSIFVTGRSNWDSVYLNVEGNGNFANDIAVVPDSTVMANGNLYPSQNKTIYFSSIPGEVHPANIVGEGNTGAPTGVNFETFFTLQDWQSAHGQMVLQSCAAFARQYHVSLIPNGWTHAKSLVGSYDNDGYMGNGSEASNAFKIQRYNDIVSHFNKLLGNYTGTTLSLYPAPSWNDEWAFGTSTNSLSPLLPQLSNGGIFEIFQVSDVQNGEVYGGFNRQSSTPTSCTQKTCGPYDGNIYTIPNRDGGKVANMTWAIGFNVSRSLGSIVETPSDWNYVSSDYLLAKSQGWTQPYSTASTGFTTSYAAIKFYLATSYMLTHTKSFEWNPMTNIITLTADTSTPTYINNTSWSMPIVFQLPISSHGQTLISASDNQTAGAIAHSTTTNEYYQINFGKGWTTMSFVYAPPTSSTSVSTTPISNTITNTTSTSTGINSTTTLTITTTRTITTTDITTSVTTSLSTTTVTTTSTIPITTTITTTVTTTTAGGTTTVTSTTTHTVTSTKTTTRTVTSTVTKTMSSSSSKIRLP